RLVVRADADLAGPRFGVGDLVLVAERVAHGDVLGAERQGHALLVHIVLDAPGDRDLAAAEVDLLQGHHDIGRQRWRRPDHADVLPLLGPLVVTSPDRLKVVPDAARAAQV